MWEIMIFDCRSELVALVTMWSISVADLGVHLVGLVIIWSRPKEKSRST